MKELSNYFRISELISKQLNNTINEAECQELSEWLSNEENKKLYDQITDKSNFQNWKNDLSKKDSEKGWEIFEKTINAKNKKPTTLTTILKYAAIFLLPIFVLASLYICFGIEDPIIDNRYADNASTETLISKPSLILDNGEKLILENDKLTAFKEKDGTKIKNEKGKLSYDESRIEPSKKILYNQVVIPKSSEYEILLSDGSKVILNSLSSLKYPVQFTGDNREVELTGEGYFEIAKDTNHPFIVKVDGMSLKVLGTTFNVKAYNTDKNIVTTLVEGAIEVEACANLGEKIKLSPNDQAKLDRKGKHFSVNAVDVAPFIAWTGGVLVFRQERLEDMMISLSRWYDIEVKYLSPGIKDQRFGGSFRRDGDIPLILNMLSYTNKVECKLEGDTIIFDKRK